MRFAIWDHAGKAVHLHKTLLNRGHQAAPTLGDADVLLLDCDWRWAHPRPEFIQAAHDAGAKVVLYPHGGLPTVFVYDGLTNPDPLVDLRLEHGPGPIQAAQEAGLEGLRQEACGWLYSDTQPFHSRKVAASLLFAPQHPNMETLAQQNGHDPGPALNQTVYQKLLALGVPFTVSTVGPAHRNGIWPHPLATIIENPTMGFDHSLELVRNADLVVAAGSMAALAVAQGKPLVMFGQGNHADYVDGQYQNPNHLEVYDRLLRYPIDVEDGDLPDLFALACAGTDATAEWRKRFVGNSGAENAVELVEELVGSVVPSSANVIIEGVTATPTASGG